MAFGSCFSCIKYSVFVFNFLLWLLGCALIGVGSWLLVDDEAGRHVIQLSTTTTPTTTTTGREAPVIVSYSQLTENNVPATLCYLFIAFGCVVIVVAFVGCCGAVRESSCLLAAFFVSLFLVFAVMLGICIWAFVMRSELDAHTIHLQRLTNRMLRMAVRDYYTDPEARKFMDILQSEFRCCGADNAAGDYVGKSAVLQPPCKIAHQRRSCLPVYFNYVGNHFEQFMRDRLLIVGSVAIGVASCMVMGMVCVTLLCCAVKERRWTANA
ncbi:CD9 antigen-like [Babylonia areolata]|uniref:CD9 antigen-like n=1 Tax=Babylonia areolata TaxID=304850 RepID=UPI003FCF595C